MSFSTQEINQVWNKGIIAPGRDWNKIRKDQCGAWIIFSDYWNRDSDNWWEIDHIQAVSKWWPDSMFNLRPLHWKNNLRTSDWKLQCPIKAK